MIPDLRCARHGTEQAELVELLDALKTNRTVFPDGKWGRATLEVCLGILDSSRTRTEIALSWQVPSRC